MEKVHLDLLNDTLNLVQLARETARSQGNEAKANRFAPIIERLQSVVNSEQPTQAVPIQPGGILAQDDFSALLSTVKNSSVGSSQSAAANSTTPSRLSAEERNKMIRAMSDGGMNDVEIARQFGITRAEVSMIVNLGARDSKRLGGV